MSAISVALAVREDDAGCSEDGEDSPAPRLIGHAGGLQILAEMTDLTRVSGRSIDYYRGAHPTLGIVALVLTVTGECLLWAGRMASLWFDLSPFA